MAKHMMSITVIMQHEIPSERFISPVIPYIGAAKVHVLSILLSLLGIHEDGTMALLFHISRTRTVSDETSALR
jgi:hypothetical protein